MMTRPLAGGTAPALTRLLALVLGLLIVAGLEVPTAVGADVTGATPLPTTGGVDYQLGGTYRPDDRVTVVVRDSTAHPVRGVYSVCYVNGFQTQPGSLRSRWSGAKRGLLLRDGRPLLRDPDWPDEVLLDTSTARLRRGIAKVVRRDIARCARRGFAAVEFDNLDSWQRSKGQLSARNNLAMARKFVRIAHRHGLLAGQKNAVEITKRAKHIGFDFAVAEECHQWRECRRYRKAYGAKVIQVEYQRKAFRRGCRAGDGPLLVLRDSDLVRRGRSAYRFALCDA